MKQTSIDAYLEAVESGELTRAREVVLELLRAEGPLTGREVDERLRSVSAHKRLSELRSHGYAQPQGRRQCRVSGRFAEQWVAYTQRTTGPHVRPMVPSSSDLRTAAEFLRERAHEDDEVLQRVAAWLALKGAR